jgi:uncharacterized membrane protein
MATHDSARPAARAGAGRAGAAERVALGAFWAFTALSVAGYATFGLHPELLARVPNAMDTYSVAFTFFPRAHVLLAFAVLALALVRHAGARWIPAFLALYAISLGSELAGTTVGLPFGAYRYTDGLGIKWFAHVPVLIPLSWFFMAVPSWVLARRALPLELRGGLRGTLLTVFVGSLVLLTWDLALDPAMSWITKYWVWGNEGPYYGMPWLNLFGWYVTGLALMGALSVLHAEEWSATLPSGWLLGYWLANLALPLGMILAAGLWLGVAVTLAGAALAFALPRLLSSGTLAGLRAAAPPEAA